MVCVDPLGEPNPLPGRLDLSHFGRGNGANLVGRWSIGSEPSPFLPLKGRLRPAALVQLLLRCRFRLEEHCGEDHLATALL